MPNHFDIIVIGVGAMGASTCFHLASRGARVLGIEQFDIPHERGSHHGESRMIRTAYYEQPKYVPLLQRACTLWDELEEVSGRKLFYKVGGLYIGPPDGGLIYGSRKSAIAHSLDHRMLSRDDLRREFPQFVVPESWQAILEAAAGFLLPEKIVDSYAKLARERGAEIHTRETMRSWTADARSATVTTDRATYEADQLIFTGGAWTQKLLMDLEVPLQVTRQVLGWVQPKKPELFQIGRLPAWAIDSLDGGVYYGFPMTPESAGFKLAHHHPAAPFDPDNPAREPRAEDEDDFRPALQQYISDADGPLVAMRICMYTNTPDHNFIIDRHPHHLRVQIACGFSGHGFKFASVIGEILADRATIGESKLPIDFLALSRFS
ncbi:MAG TPA: N-methyl-L-tryptophan oxidase [Tepidisphaeraceae bacterium]|nr:N-methyl-L-tryptophan oxidase [Tepidisphaeraceae bacterium]